MPPRRSSSKSRSQSASKSPRKSSPRASARLSGTAPSKSPSLPPPDPAAVQRLIDEAIARAQRNRAAEGGAAPAVSAPSSALATRPGGVRGALSFLFGSRNCTYAPSTTATITDLTGAFLVTCITVYFTAAGYLFYRELATGA